MKKILITNDDGIFADGLIRLVKAAVEFGEVWVVAPDTERSGRSHSINIRNSFDAWKVDFPVEGVHAFVCSGYPTDCVRVGTLNIVPGGADYCFSGINYGYNLATDLQYSATAGGAFEGAFQGLHTIAFSEEMNEVHEPTDRYLREIMAELIEMPLDKNRIWNVNFPGGKLADCKGVLRDRVVSMDVFYDDRYTETKVSEDRSTFMIDGRRNWKASEGTDLRAILDGYVSVGIATNIS